MMFSYLKAFIRDNRIKLLLTLSSLSLYFVAVAIAVTLSNSITDIATLPMKSIGAETVVQKSGKIPNQMLGAIFPHSNAPIDQNEIEKIASAPFVTDYDSALYFWYFDSEYFKSVLGARLDEGLYADILRNSLASGQFPQNSNEILATEDFVKKTGLGLGASITLGESQFIISGVLRSQFNGNIAPADLYLDIQQAQHIAGQSREMKTLYDIRDDDFYNMLVIKSDPLWQGDKRKHIQAIDKSFLVFGEESFKAEITGQLLLLSSSASLAFAVLGGLLAIGFALMVYYGVKARENEIALLRMLGWTFRALRNQFMGESLALSVAALLLGNALYGLALIYLAGLEITMELPWDISAKPHFLPDENNIERVISAPLPINFDLWSHLALNFGMLTACAGLTYLLLYRLRSIKPVDFYKT